MLSRCDRVGVKLVDIATADGSFTGRYRLGVGVIRGVRDLPGRIDQRCWLRAWFVTCELDTGGEIEMEGWFVDAFYVCMPMYGS